MNGTADERVTTRQRMFSDLHLHTRFSDGTYTPAELVAAAVKHELSAIALTDHDTIEGCDAAEKACADASIEFIPGVELTAEHDDHEIHVLGYYFDRTNSTFLAEIARCQAVRQDRIREMVSRLNSLDVPLNVESVFTLANCRSPGRPHVARALVQEGFVDTLDEAFDRFLKKNRPAWVPKLKMSVTRAIELIHDAGGLAVFAHPGLTRCDSVIPTLVEHGLDGIECYHTKHNAAAVLHYQAVAKHFGLLITGGSDCHGLSKGKPLIGSVKLPCEHVERLKAAQQNRRRVGGPGLHL